MTALTAWLDGLEDFSPAKNQRTSRRLGGSQGTAPDRPRLIVIHTMETPEDTGRARSTALWVQTSGGTAQVSCHFCVDDAEAIRCVADEHTAFTQLTPWNDMSLSIEQAGRAAQNLDEWFDAYSVGQRALTARIVAAWCERWSIPPVYLTADQLVAWRTCTGITTHHQISLASQRPELLSLGYKPGNHWDPGPNYPMADLLARVAALLNPPPPLPPLEDDEMALYATNSEDRSIEIRGSNADGSWPPAYLIYAIEIGGRIRRVAEGEWVTAKAQGKPATPLTNSQLDYQYAVNGQPRG